MKFRYLLALMGLLILYPVAEASQRRSPVVVAVEKVSPAVVNISTVVQERVTPFFPFAGDDFFKDFFPEFFSREYQRTSLGSGVIVDGKNGYIVTNHHVIARASEIKVITSDQKEYMGRSLGSDPRSDLAVIKIDAEEVLPEAKLGDSEDLMIGETVIGINTAIYQKAQGIGFAIPINKAKRIVRELLRAGEVRPPWIGLDLQELTPDLIAHFGVPGERRGVLVGDLHRDSPAHKAGIKRGDVIVGLEGFPVDSPEAYKDALGEYTPGERLSFRIIRKGKDISLPVEASSFPLELAPELFYRRLGIKIAGGDRKVQAGIVIEEVKADSEAGRIGLRSGDVILQINRQAVTGMDDFKEAVSRAHHLSSLPIVVKRGAYAYSLTLPF